jgi:hypothetical protein
MKPNLHPSLAEVTRKEDLNPKNLRVGLNVDPKRNPAIPDRTQVLVSDSSKSAVWNVPSVRALFRGDQTPPSFSDGPDDEYMPLFRLVEGHAVAFCDAVGDKTDGEFEEAYSNLRRRPDGKPLNPLHTYLWQAGALLAGTFAISAAEFDAIFGRLARSASTFRMGLVSRNYIDVVRRFEA